MPSGPRALNHRCPHGAVAFAFRGAFSSAPVVVFALVLSSVQVGCSFRSLDYLQKGVERDAGGDSRPNADHNGNPQDASLDTDSPVAPPDGAKKTGTNSDAGTLGPDSTRKDDGAPASDLAERDAPVPDGQDLASDSMVPIDRFVFPPDGAKSPIDSSVDVLDTQVLGPETGPPLPDGSVPVFDTLESLPDSPAPIPDSLTPVYDTAVLLYDAMVSDTASEVAPDLGSAIGDTSPDLSLDLVRDSGSTDASSSSAEITFQTGATKVGMTYTNSFDLGNESNRLLVVALAWDNSAVGNPSITYAGSSMALAEKDVVNSQALAIYYAVAPPAGVGDLIVTYSSSVNLSVAILGLRNVSSSSPVTAKGMTSANWAVLISGGDTLYDGSMALVYDMATTGNNEIPTVTGAPYGLQQTVTGRPTSPYLSVGAGYCPTAGRYDWTFSYADPHWHGIVMLEIRSSL